MALNLIPTNFPDLTPGEKRVANKLKLIYSDVDYECHLYVQPRLKYLNPDFILIDAYKGISILEIKDWSKEYISIPMTNTYVTNINGEKFENPVYKANKYFNFAKHILQSSGLFFDEYGNFDLNIYSRVIFPNMNSETLDDIKVCFNQKPTECICADQLRKLSLDNLFSEKTCYIDKSIISNIRRLFFPEITIKTSQTKIWKFNRKEKSTNPLVAALDGEQEKFARQIPYGHFMVSGVPGSGKTVILLARAIHLIKEKPNWKIRILTYNKSLSSQLKNRLDSLQEDLEYMGINHQNIRISTFHSLATDFLIEPMPTVKTNHYWNHVLPLKASQNAKPFYDAILIDEYQDFLDSWIKLCVSVCKKHNHNGSKIENLFFAGDRLQSIYNQKEQSWKSLGVNIVGRSKLLKTSYRSGSNHINLALDYLMRDSKLKKEVEKFYEGRNNICCAYEIDNSVDFVTGDIDNINNYVTDLLKNQNYNPEDVLILSPASKGKNGIGEIYKKLDEHIKVISLSDKEIKTNKMDITTYHSSKGLECKVCILLNVDATLTNVDAVTQKKLHYVGMTRASEKLCIHSFSSKGGEIFNELHSLYEEMKKPVDNDIVLPNEQNEVTEKTKEYSVKDIRKTYPNAYRPWSKNEEDKLINLYSSNQSIERIAEELGRQNGAVVSRLKKLELIEEDMNLPMESEVSNKKSENQNNAMNTSYWDDLVSSTNIKKEKFGLRSKLRKLTSFFIQDKNTFFEEASNVKNEILKISTQKWVYELIEHLKSQEKYNLKNTVNVTWNLIENGNTIYDIANIRNLKVETISTHLIALAILGKKIPEVTINRELTPNEQIVILDALKKGGLTRKRNIKQMLGNNFTYKDIDLMLALLISYNRNNQF